VSFQLGFRYLVAEFLAKSKERSPVADFEVAVIGAGVVGLAIAARLAERHPSLVVLERNERYGMETSSRNSEVIHAGIYYAPGSLRAALCVEGRDELYALCRAHGIPYRPQTKIITAVAEEEVPRLDAIAANAAKNGVVLERLSREATLKLEPNIRTFGSLFSPLTGVISVHGLMDHYYHTATRAGAIVQQRCRVTGVEPAGNGYRLILEEDGARSSVEVDCVVNAAGLDCDTIAALAGIDIDGADYRLNYVKGSYFAIVPSKARLLTRLVYPVPTNEGLGVHALMDWGGRLKFGPDVEYLHDRVQNYAVDGSKRSAFAESIRRILPQIRDEDIVPDMSGIRPKLQHQGQPARDFVIVHERERGLEGFVNLIGIDSPGLTASPAIGRYVEKILFG
jgi:L-2-hydroxyglutarate oxidase LhgO